MACSTLFQNKRTNCTCKNNHDLTPLPPHFISQNLGGKFLNNFIIICEIKNRIKNAHLIVNRLSSSDSSSCVLSIYDKSNQVSCVRNWYDFLIWVKPKLQITMDTLMINSCSDVHSRTSWSTYFPDIEVTD